VMVQKMRMRPFHMDCPVTKKPICRCAHSKTPLEELERSFNRNQDTKRMRQAAFDIAFDMHLYYEGFENPAQYLREMHRRRETEKERLLNLAKKDHCIGFERFVDGIDADEQAREDAYGQIAN
jgi:hypothetical protein